MKDTIRSLSSALERRRALETLTGVRLGHIGSFSIREDVAGSRNCENMIGAVQVPVGVAGPLVYRGTVSGERKVYVPLATTEGALVASVNRGMKAICDSGGAIVETERVGPTRAPVFAVSSFEESRRLRAYLSDNFGILKKIAQATSHHLTLVHYEIFQAGRHIFVRFSFNTQDAMGLNMVTIASDAIVRIIEKDTAIRCVSLSGNLCADKKPSWINAIRGRGYTVRAEITVCQKTVRDVLKTTPRKLYETWVAKCMVGSALAGAMSFTAHVANVIAAVFLATGQDIAHVTEGSVGITTTDIVGSDLYTSVALPDILVGTVGGGTHLETQKEALELLGVFGGDGGRNAQRLAEIIGATALAGELSLLASLSEGSLARAHERLGREQKQKDEI